ncbi:MAG: hypothetical protein ABIH36_01960 [bacterium]
MIAYVLSATHTIISLPLGVYLQNPFLIFAAAFLLHLLADSILHWNIDPNKRPYPYTLVAIDVLGGITLALLITINRLPLRPAVIAMIGSNTPDIIHTLYNLLGPVTHTKYLNWLKPLFHFHNHIQRETNNIPRGLVFQITLVALALTLVLAR